MKIFNKSKRQYALRDHRAYAETEDGYMALQQQHSKITNKYKEQVAKARQEVDDAHKKAIDAEIKDASGSATAKEVRQAADEHERALKQVTEAEAKLQYAEKQAGYLEGLIKEKSRDLTEARRNAAMHLLPEMRAEHGPAVEKVILKLQELSDALKEEREIATRCQSLLYGAGVQGLLTPMPHCNQIMNLNPGTMYGNWLATAKSTGYIK